MSAYPRYFNTSGPNNPAQHYTLMRPAIMAKGKEMVYRERYFTIWAPRQTGKSTYFRLLATELEKEDYRVCHINIEGFNTADEHFLCHHLSRHLSLDFKENIQADNLDWLFENLTTIKDNKFVFIIDEIEGLNPLLFNRFLHHIRAAYHSRNTHSLKSVILVGVSNITGLIQDNASPFNIADNLEMPYFSQAEVSELLEQHETESGQLFEPKVKQKIYAITAGQPGLVNGFGLKLSENKPNKETINYDDYLKIENWYLYEAIDKNVSNIINKAKNHRNLVEELLFSEQKRIFDIDDEAIRYLHVHGLLKRDKEGNVEFWVPLYKKRLQKYFYPRMNGEANELQGNIWLEKYLMPNKSINIDKIIRDYQEYANRRGFKYFIEKDADGKPKGLREAALIYSFETYIQAFLLAVEGKSYLEPHVALGRSDLIVNIKGTEFVIEAKIFYNWLRFSKGKQQLAYYVKNLGLTMGIYLIFVNRKITHPEVKESIETIEGISLHTYLVWYDLEKDFG
jgi:hypothetical protein